MRRPVTMLAALLALGVLSGVGAYEMALPTEVGAHWQEIAWPFPRDGWPAGRAFRCSGGPCDGVELYVRAKLGFCNCDSGVADDDEVDRVADVDLISPRFAAVAPGEVVRIGEMGGRARRYDLDMQDGARHVAAGIAVSHRCDLLVAVAHGAGEASAVEHAALELLGTRDMKNWMVAALDGK